MVRPDYATRDLAHWQRLRAIFERSGFTDPDVLGNFAAYVRRRDMVRFLAHYELFKLIVDLPGCIVEAGVFRGASFFTWVKLMNVSRVTLLATPSSQTAQSWRGRSCRALQVSSMFCAD